jgi:hypothetical protein
MWQIKKNFENKFEFLLKKFHRPLVLCRRQMGMCRLPRLYCVHGEVTVGTTWRLSTPYLVPVVTRAWPYLKRSKRRRCTIVLFLTARGSCARMSISALGHGHAASTHLSLPPSLSLSLSWKYLLASFPLDMLHGDDNGSIGCLGFSHVVPCTIL